MALFLLALTFSVITACAADRGTTPTAQVTMADSADYVWYQVRHLMVNGGVKQGQLNSDTAFMLDNGNRLEFRGSVHVILLDSIGVPSATLTANEATYNIARKTMEARGNVVATTTDGKRLDTQHLIFDQMLNKVRSDSAFVLVEPTQRVTGSKFTSDPNMKVMTCEGGCTYVGTSSGREGGVPTDTLNPVYPTGRGGGR
jgi:LPS export ABC transporter protein LptC